MSSLYNILIFFLLLTIVASRTSKFDKIEEDRDSFDEDLLWGGDDDEDADNDVLDDDWHPDQLSEEVRNARFTKLIHKMDENSDGHVDKVELIHWTLKALQNMDSKEIEDDFHTADEDQDTEVSWDEYVKNIFGLDKTENFGSELDDNYELQDFNRHFNREHARWAAADSNADGKLTLDEYEIFYNPQKQPGAIEVAIEEAMGRVDTNKDGALQENEYLADFKEPWVAGDEWISNEKETFSEMDLNKNNQLDGEELKLWLQVDNGEIAIDEAMHLIEMADQNDDGQLSHEEVMQAMEDFIESDATEYGGQLRHDEL